MHTLISILACLASNPIVCEKIAIDKTYTDGNPITFNECLGIQGQLLFLEWKKEHPQYDTPKTKLRCSLGSDQSVRERNLDQGI